MDYQTNQDQRGDRYYRACFRVQLTKAYWWIRILLLSLKWLRGIKLGTMVEYKGDIWIVVNGAYCSRSWDIARGDARINCVPESSLSKVKNLANYMHGFKSGYRFYMNCWFSIWVNEGIKPWMRGCNIWR